MKNLFFCFAFYTGKFCNNFVIFYFSYNRVNEKANSGKHLPKEGGTMNNKIKGLIGSLHKNHLCVLAFCIMALFCSEWKLSHAEGEEVPEQTVKEEIEAMSTEDEIEVTAEPVETEVAETPAEEVSTEEEVAEEELMETICEAEEVESGEDLADHELDQITKNAVESHPSAYIAKATIVTEEGRTYTVFRKGRVVNFNVDEYIQNVSEEELLYKLVEAESGNQSSLGRRLVTDCVLNMAAAGDGSVKSAILKKGVFDVVAYGSIFETNPKESTIQCVDTELEGQIDYSVMWFRTGHYHNFGVPFEHVGAHWFSKPAPDDAGQWQAPDDPNA